MITEQKKPRLWGSDYPEGTLGKVVSEMIRGWGYLNPKNIRSLGQAVKGVIDSQPSTRDLFRSVVKVRHESGTIGEGENFRWWYEWIIRGVHLDENPFGLVEPPKSLFRAGGIAVLPLVDGDGFRAIYISGE